MTTSHLALRDLAAWGAASYTTVRRQPPAARGPEGQGTVPQVPLFSTGQVFAQEGIAACKCKALLQVYFSDFAFPQKHRLRLNSQ